VRWEEKGKSDKKCFIQLPFKELKEMPPIPHHREGKPDESESKKNQSLRNRGKGDSKRRRIVFR